MTTSCYKLASALAWIALLGACSSNDPLAIDDSLVLTEMTPSANATNVDVGTTVGLTFSHQMPDGAKSYVGLYEGGLTGPRVPGTWSWSQDHTHLEFHPDAPLRNQFRYTVHLGGAIQDTQGHHLNYEQCLNMHGGQWAWGHMMGGHQMGAGWMHGNGSYGVFFGFETG
jgi:hypothetical protein